MSENKEWGWLIIVIIAAVFLPFLVMGGFGGGHMVGIMGYGGGYMLFIPLILGLIALGIYYLVTSSSRTSSSSRGRRGRAIEILKERYAKGEITREQFLKMREELEA